MSYKYTVKKEDGYIAFDVRGDADTVADASWFANAAIHEAMNAQCDRLFLDERTLNMRLSSYDVYELAESFSEKLPLSGLRVAVLHSEMNKDVGNLFETMLLNRSVSYRSFMDKELALSWLLGKPPAESPQEMPGH